MPDPRHLAFEAQYNVSFFWGISSEKIVNCCRLACWSLIFLLLWGLILGCAATNRSPEAVPRDIQAHKDLARSYLAAQEPRRSLRELAPLRSRAKNYSEFQFLLGATYAELDNCVQAVEHYQRAVDLQPDYGAAWNNLGQAYAACQEKQLAAQAFQKAMELSTYLTPEYPAYNLSRLYRNQGRLEKAEQYAAKAVDLNWRYVPAYNQLVDIHLEQGQRTEAVRWLRKAVQAFPDNEHFLFKLAENELKQGNKEQAVFWLQRILEVDPDSSIAEMASDYLDIIEQ